jgi:undecaprenyl-diphosphatase
MSWIVAALLGVVQGLTEFLPVSSSAHLVLARAFFGWNVDEGAFGLAFDVALHAGTLVAIVAYFRRDLLEMLAAAPQVLSAPRGSGKVARLIVIGTIPVVPARGRELAEGRADAAGHRRTLAVGASDDGCRTARIEDCRGGADAVGCVVGAQATALVPGMSRSGSTMSMAMLLGLTRESAARFSFLLGVPAIGAAAAKEGLHILKAGMTGHDAALFVLGMTVSAVVGYLTIRYFLRYLAGHSLDAFAYYRLALAAVTIVWLLAR